MNNDERKVFWDVLCNAQDTSLECIKEIQKAIKRPDFLCRFRSVNENTLIQLQENKLYYSSADYYDDPFDTFIHVDIVGRQTAQGLYNISSTISQGNAQPGDLIFFTGTYNSGSPVSHVGIYLGNGQIIHAGDPIKITNINTSYWQSHFYSYGRI